MVVILLIIIAIFLAAIFGNTLLMGHQMKGSYGADYSEILKKLDTIQNKVEAPRQGKVTKPFDVANKTHVRAASSSHIIIRKSPDQIRNENYEKIKQGAQYGNDH